MTGGIFYDIFHNVVMKRCFLKRNDFISGAKGRADRQDIDENTRHFR
ncbi:hypothetical protein BRYFOR_07848 [Marvinbryantia formatexigens DSM 14469]|uniref:Uncharacterized protein n=1 Tax=Marvinbryantia formatexigens DSM 14469 TaxID=478749 RepID=C6LGT8_9FIRM|nr:hypothetical protein BRYFOR_07848 [Marvinbryantia formatexigens DSM 14469]